LEAFSAFVLAVTMYGITRDEDHELAMLALVCRVAEGVLGTLSIPSYLGLVWLAKAGGRAGCPGHLCNECAARAQPPPPRDLLCREGPIFSYLLLRGRMAPVSIAWTGVFASGLLAVALPCNSPVSAQGR